MQVLTQPDPAPTTLMTQSKESLYRQAAFLALFTILYNIAEGIVSVFCGASDETITLFGFGLDSFVEVISGIGVWHMVRRLQQGEKDADRFERRALRITGSAFYLLAAGLAITATINFFQGHRPVAAVWGIVVATASLIIMWFLMRLKMKVGTALASPAILADAACTRTCLYLSALLLAASVGYELTGSGSLDSIGTLAMAWFSAAEGRESFAKARGELCRCAGKCGGARGEE